MTDKDSYKPGEIININMWIDNSGDTRDIITSLVVKSYGIGEIEEGTIPFLMTDESTTVKSGLILGFKPSEITVNIAGEKRR